jgi:hypothetical protein
VDARIRHFGGDDGQLGQGRLHVGPGLEARGLREQRAHAEARRLAERLAFQAGTGSLATSKLYTRAVLPPAIPGSWSGAGLACSSSGTPSRDLRQDFPRLGKRRLAVWVVRTPHHVVPHHGVGADDARRRMPMASSLKPSTTLRRKKSLGGIPPPVFARAGPPLSRGQALEPVNRLAVALAGLTRAQREHGFRHPIDHAQKGAGRTLRQQLPLFPTTHCRDRYADPARELGL